MSRFEEVVNDAIGEVVLGESAFRAETLAAAHRREGPRPPGRAAAPRSTSRPATRSTSRRRSSGIADAGDLLAARRRGGQRGRHAAADRRPRPGHDRVPVRPDARRRRARTSGCSTTASPRTRSSASSRPSRWPPTTSAGSARCTSAARRAATPTSTPSGWSQIVEESMSSEIYELMKRSDEGAVVEKAHRRPRFVEDCVREMIRGVVEQLDFLVRPALRLRAPGEPRDDPPAQRAGRALRALGELRQRDRHRRALPAPLSLREWLDGAN